jgi:hypothetical protein
MKALIQRLLSRAAPQPAPRRYTTPPPALSSELSPADLESYYLRIVTDCLRRMLIGRDCIEIGVKRSGAGPNGLIPFSGYVRITKWDPVIAPVLLQNMPVIDARVRKVVEASVLLEGTYFVGLWFMATSQVPGVPTTLMGMPAEIVRQPGGASTG